MGGDKGGVGDTVKAGRETRFLSSQASGELGKAAMEEVGGAAAARQPAASALYVCI